MPPRTRTTPPGSTAVSEAETAKTDYHRAIRHLAGASMREITEALNISHQRVHQMIEEAGGTAGWKPRQKPGQNLSCTFCGKTKNEVGKLIAGPSVLICDNCVALCTQIIENAQTTAGSHLGKVPNSSTFTCSFCTRPAAGLERLIAGPGVKICNQCVNFCTEVLAALPAE